jgi:hypothetical protein
MVYVLASSVSQKLSSVYRLSTSDISNSAVSSTTVELIPDTLIKAVKGPFGHLGNYRNYLSSDGTLSLATRSYYNGTKAVFEALPKNLVAGNYLITRFLSPILLPGSATELNKVVQNSALGSQILPTNDGFLVLE